MNKHILTVPLGIKYISEWKDYTLPDGHCIVDKGVTGCGYTEYCLRNDKNVILCSPRKMLLENKSRQHVEDKNILYLENDIKDLETKVSFENKISAHITNCLISNLPIKFMITYDSAHYIFDYLSEHNKLNEFYIVADEFQSIFLDSYFKAEVENSFLRNAQKARNLIYLSATPMLDKYLNMLDEFKYLDYYFLDWEKSGYIETVQIFHKRTNSLIEEAKKIVLSYLKGDYPIIVDDNKGIHFSKEAVFFFNSVSEIKRVITNMNLSRDQVNILCADTPANKSTFKKVGIELGKIPLRGEGRKMFTFCTSTVYVGADFYSDCASTYIFADPNLKSLALDISMDLPQIVGRQRDRENPFKNNITIFYKTTRKENLKNREEFDKLQRERRKNTLNLLKLYQNMEEAVKDQFVGKCISDIKVKNYSNDFVSISSKGDLVYNKLIEVANERAWEVSQDDYRDSISVTRELKKLDYINQLDKYRDEDDKVVDEFLQTRFFTTGNFDKKLEMFCEFMEEHKLNPYITNMMKYKITDLRYHNYYNFFGIARCRALKYRELNLLNELVGKTKVDVLAESIYNRFNVGEKYSLKTAKSILSEVYSGLKLTNKPKALDLKEWFEIKKVTIIDPVTKKRDNGLELLSKI